MVKIVYIEHDGVAHEVATTPGESLMVAAVWGQVPGILGRCGGDGGCATCHVYVDPAWTDKIGPASLVEKHTLRFAHEPSANSRLACQMRATQALDGLVLRIPPRQY